MIVIIYGILAITATLTTVSFYFFRQRKGLPAILVSLGVICFHPMWYYGGGGGDCGQSMVQMAMPITLLLALLLIIQLALWKFRRVNI